MQGAKPNRFRYVAHSCKSFSQQEIKNDLFPFEMSWMSGDVTFLHKCEKEKSRVLFCFLVLCCKKKANKMVSKGERPLLSQVFHIEILWSGLYSVNVHQSFRSPAVQFFFKATTFWENASSSTLWVSFLNFLVYLCFSLQDYNDSVAVSAQAWTEKCVLAHGPPSTRLLNGIFLPLLFLCLSLFPL